MKLRKGDTVKVLSGNDNGKTGEILSVDVKNNKVIVKGINIKKRATKPRRAGEEGGIIASEYPIDASNVAYVDAKGEVVKIGYSVNKNGKKVRVSRKSGAELKK